MPEATYSVIFRGDLQPGYTVADVKANFARLFKAGPETVEKLFSGRPLALKKGLTQAQAGQLQATLSKLGAQSVVRAEGDNQPEQPTPAPRSEPAVSATSPAPAAPAAASNSSLSLAPMEGDLLKEHEKAKVEPVQVAVGHLSLKPAEGNLVEDGERRETAPAPVTVPDWNLQSTAATFKIPD
ncbi:hypothetical protein [uncultured Microbulbifer sp.]|uniref:hypothetical protein n=1 Tax=uncultured Microbulbifer sp. TaxID=348147 RepID=UPI0025FEF65E|nr:hypothetical protein [uncultured Microbulbifer sp.]